jgi:hypothetical protein
MGLLYVSDSGITIRVIIYLKEGIMKVFNIVSSKNGQGTTTTAAALAILTSEMHQTAIIEATPHHDLFAVLAISDRGAGTVHDASETLLAVESDNVIESYEKIKNLGDVEFLFIDWGTTEPTITADVTLGVVRTSYLPARRWVKRSDMKADALICLHKETDALKPEDMASATGVQRFSVVLMDHQVERSSDAGLFLHRLPRSLRGDLQSVVPRHSSV